MVYAENERRTRHTDTPTHTHTLTDPRTHAQLQTQSLPQPCRRRYASGICAAATGSSESAFRNPRSPKNASFNSPG
eukprot:13662990-Alexandrium_andersonii.AAC.1